MSLSILSISLFKASFTASCIKRAGCEFRTVSHLPRTTAMMMDKPTMHRSYHEMICTIITPSLEGVGEGWCKGQYKANNCEEEIRWNDRARIWSPHCSPTLQITWIACRGGGPRSSHNHNPDCYLLHFWIATLLYCQMATLANSQE